MPVYEYKGKHYDLSETDPSKAKAKIVSFLGESSAEPSEPGVGKKIGAGLYGAATGFAGGLGELETLGAYTIPEALGLRERGQRDKFLGRETIFPTVKETEQALAKIGIQPPREEVSGYRTAGELIGGLGSTLPKALRTGTRALLGTPTRTAETYAQEAEKLGFKLSPAQVRATEPVGAKGATGWAEKNQTLANRLASKGTGKEVAEISPDFVRERLSTLGKEFDSLYKGKTFNIDQQAVSAIDGLRQAEQLFPGSVQVPAIKSTAENIIANFSQLAGKPGAKPGTFAISGDALQTIRNDLSQAARSTANRGDAHRIYELIDAIDGSIARNNPGIAKALGELRPKYRNTVILEDLTRRNGIQQGNISLERLGDMLGARRSGVRSTQDIDQLGEIGRQLNLQALWQRGSEIPAADIVGRLAGSATAGAATAAGLRSRAARAAQRRLAPPASEATEALERRLVGPGVGSMVAPVQREEE
jgi:hypothetical protein